MPSELSHIDIANNNQATIKWLVMNDFDEHLPWIGTIAFYKALHVVEAVLAPKFGTHQTTHQSRNQFVAKENSLKNPSALLSPLFDVAKG